MAAFSDFSVGFLSLPALNSRVCSSSELTTDTWGQIEDYYTGLVTLLDWEHPTKAVNLESLQVH